MERAGVMLFLPRIEWQRERHANRLDELARCYQVAVWSERCRYARQVSGQAWPEW